MMIFIRVHSRIQLKIAIVKILHLPSLNYQSIKVMDLILFPPSKIQEEKATQILQKVGIILTSKIMINNHKFLNK